MSEKHKKQLWDIAMEIADEVPYDIRRTLDGVRWLIARNRDAQRALRELEAIRAEDLAAAGMARAAAAVSAARADLSAGRGGS